MSEETKGLSFLQRVTMAQNELKAPKNQYNSFGKYKYRSAEDILEAVKPINIKYGLTLTISDCIEIVGDRYYVSAIAYLMDWYSDRYIERKGYAREPQSKKGMDESQITGGSSSYARKYALNGLYLIDDTKDDPDMQKPKSKQQTKQQPKDKFAERRGSALQRIRQLDQKHNAEEGASYGWIAQRVTGKTGKPMKDITKDNIKLVEDMITYLEQK